MTARVAWILAALMILGTAGRADRLEGAAWTMAGPAGLRALSGADGVSTAFVRAGQPCLGTAPGSLYLYFQADPTQPASGLLYAVVRYFDASPGSALSLQYDSTAGDSLTAKYRPADDQAGGFALGTRRWKTAIFLLKTPRFAHRQNLGADFRLSGSPLLLASVRLSHQRPADWNAVDAIPSLDVKPLVHIGPGGQLIVGGFDPAHPSDVGPQTHALRAAIPALRQLGVTSHEVYVRWNLCETSPGHFDWSVYDPYVKLYRQAGLKWVPFLILGSAYSLPDWYYKKPGSQGYVCLEHHQESDIQSLWNPSLRGHVIRFVRAFCHHYGQSGVIESILLGVTGNYGEAIYPASGNDWTADIHGPYHTHRGFWAGDPYAVASFRRWLARKYGTPARLSKAWGTQTTSFQAVQPFLRPNAPNDRAWLDFMDWYIGSMTDWAHFWLATTRRYFPHGGIYLCTGGDAAPEHGSDFAAQCQAASQVGGGVRITNEGSDYRANFSLTRWVASAGRQYGAYFSFEPAGGVDAQGVVARIYNATASGARGLHYYYPNLFSTPAARDNFVKYGAQFRQRHPIVQVAVYYPETFIKLHGNDFLRYVQPLRDRLDFDYMSDRQIMDGGLSRIRALVLLHGNVSEGGVWNQIVRWVRQGGLLLYPDGMGPLRTVEGSEAPQATLFGPHANRGHGRTLTFHGEGNSAAYRAFVAGTLSTAPELSPDTRAMVQADGAEDGVFVTLCAPHELLWLNTTDHFVYKGASLNLPPMSIVSGRAHTAGP